MGNILTRWNGVGDLYPLSSFPPSVVHPDVTFSVVSPSTWHNRLGHPVDSVFSLLRSQSYISCNKQLDYASCLSCPLGKQVRPPFNKLLNNIIDAFDIVHAEL